MVLTPTLFCKEYEMSDKKRLCIEIEMDEDLYSLVRFTKGMIASIVDENDITYEGEITAVQFEPLRYKDD